MLKKHYLLQKIGLASGFYFHRRQKVDLFECLMIKYMHPEFRFIQVGANDGERYDPLKRYIENYDISGVMVEPASEHFAKLQEKYKNNKRIVLVKKAVTIEEGQFTLYKPNPSSETITEAMKGIASLFKDHHEKSKVPIDQIVSEDVEGVTLGTLIEEYGLETLDLLMIDAEGSDFGILNNLDMRKIRPKIIYYEHGRPDEVMSREQFMVLMEKLADNGYKVYRDSYDCIAHL